MKIDLRTLLIGLPLCLVAAGCSESGSSGGGSASTASGVTTPGGTTTSTGLAPIPQAPASQGSGIDAFNGEFQDAWDRLLPGLKDMLQQQVQGLAGSLYSKGAIDIEVVNLQTVQSQMLEAPGLSQFSTDRLALRIPETGTWDLVLEGDIRVTLTISGSIAPHIDLPVKITVSNLSAEVELEFDQTDPTRPTVKRVGQPQVNFNVTIDSTSSLLSQITPVLSPIANVVAHYMLNNALGGLLPTLQSLQGLPGPIPGAGAPPLADSGTATPFEDVMNNIEDKIFRDHLPHGTILAAVKDAAAPNPESWEDAYKPGGPGSVGTTVRYGSGGDSAIFTGQYLAAQAYRYSVTQNNRALQNLERTLKGIGKLLDVNGGRGLLARCAAPQGSVVAQSFSSTYGTAQIDGRTWVGYQGSNGISRDQYSGVFYGLAIAYELVDVPHVRQLCQRRLEMMLDYLIANDWVVDEDRAPLGHPTLTTRGPTFWAGVGNQKVAFLLMGHRMNPTKYAHHVAAAGPVSEMAWFAAWTGVMGVDHYYKFNLSHMAYYNYFRLDTDPQRWQDFNRAFKIIRRYVGHHHNAQFDMIASTVDPSTAAVYHPQTREVMRRFLKRNHREVAPPVVDLSGVTYVPVTTSGYQNVGSSVTLSTTTTMMPSEPLDIPLRRYTGHFQWQRDPFRAATPNAGNDKYEKHGLDAVLPYWMGRFYGAF